jgi:hypothetical protein
VAATLDTMAGMTAVIKGVQKASVDLEGWAPTPFRVSCPQAAQASPGPTRMPRVRYSAASSKVQ